MGKLWRAEANNVLPGIVPGKALRLRGRALPPEGSDHRFFDENIPPLVALPRGYKKDADKLRARSPSRTLNKTARNFFKPKHRIGLIAAARKFVSR